MIKTTRTTTELSELRLSANLLGFIRYVRHHHFNIGIQESVDCQKLAVDIHITQKKQLQYALKALLCTSVTDWRQFDALFETYWNHNKITRNDRASAGGKGLRISALSPPTSTKDSMFEVVDATTLDGSNASDSNMSHQGASAIESLIGKDFNQLTNARDMQTMEMLVEQLAQRIRKRLLRRHHLDKHGQCIDIRHTLRNSLCYGGLPLALKFRKRRQYTPKLVLLLDVSRSMSVYSYLFLRFARGLLNIFKNSDAFAFHTHLVHIAEALREPNSRQLAEKMALLSVGWNGGTRIDRSLGTFNRDYAKQVLNSRSMVIIVSDGYDTGEPEALVKALKVIKRRAQRVIWLNPLLGLKTYSPRTRCMQAALPFIDLFAPAHNLQSLAALATQFSRL